jgi:DNA invertase Pin-like site-specific DNA recombinase
MLMTTFGYIRVSTNEQDFESQKLAILDFARTEKINIDDFMEVKVSSRKTTKKRKVDELLEALMTDDVLIVSELSRLARSVGQIAIIVNELIKKKVQFISIKENIRINGKMDISAKVMVTMFSLFAEIERDLISERTKEGLKAAKAKGKKLGRPKGSRVLRGKEDFIKNELKYGTPHSVIARKIGVGRDTISRFVKDFKLKQQVA